MNECDSTRLGMYLKFERLSIDLDAQAERVREIMDHLWLELSDEEHAILNDRCKVTDKP